MTQQELLNIGVDASLVDVAQHFADAQVTADSFARLREDLDVSAGLQREQAKTTYDRIGSLGIEGLSSLYSIHTSPPSEAGTANGDAGPGTTTFSENDFYTNPAELPVTLDRVLAANVTATDSRLRLPDIVEAGFVDGAPAALQTQERQRLIAKVAQGLGKTASETWRVARRVTRLTAMTVGGLTLAGVVATSPAVIVHGAINGPRDVAAGNHQTNRVEYQRYDGGPIVDQFSSAYRKNPQAYFPIASQFAKQPLAHGVEFAKGLYETGGAVALTVLDAAVVGLGYRRFKRRRQSASTVAGNGRSPRGNGQLAAFDAILDGPEEPNPNEQQVIAFDHS
jgi:hypothetical protein